MDFPVEFTLHLRPFPDRSEVMELLRSHDLVTSDLGQGRLRVTGSFLQLRAVKLRLETKTSPSSSPGSAHSPGSAPSPGSAHSPGSSSGSAHSPGFAPSPGSAHSLLVDSDVFRCVQNKTRY